MEPGNSTVLHRHICQAGMAAYCERPQGGNPGSDAAPSSVNGAETPEQYEMRIEEYALAVRYFLDHPEAPLNPVARAFVESIRKELASAEGPVQQ